MEEKIIIRWVGTGKLALETEDHINSELADGWTIKNIAMAAESPAIAAIGDHEHPRHFEPGGAWITFVLQRKK